MAMSSMRAAGIIYLKMDGEQLPARGTFTYKLSGEQKNMEANGDGSAYITGKAEIGNIKGSITDYHRTQHARIKAAEGVTVILELGNGKVIAATEAVQVDPMEGNSETGELPVEFRSGQVVEIR